MIITILSFIFVLSLLIFVHEFGHYIIAKLSGIGVEQFSIGMPPRLFGVKIGETEYCISAIPFGGYVKLTGQDDFSFKEEKKEIGPKDFRGKPAHVKIAVLAAGSLMNLLTALFIFFMLFRTTGFHESSNIIGYVTPDTVADKIGLRAGDEVVAINGKEVDALEKDIITLYMEDNVSITVKNQSGERTVTLGEKLDQNKVFGVQPYYNALVDNVLSGSPAEEAGVKSGDAIIDIDGEQIVGGWYHMTEIIRSNPDKKMLFTLERNGEKIQLPIKLGHAEEQIPDGSSKTVGRLGVYPKIETRKAGFGESFVLAFNETKYIIIKTIDFIVKLFTFRISSKLLGGPVLIAQMAGESAKTGLVSLLNFTAFISINLGVLNLLPFPVLDGGHISILLIEAVIRKKLSTKFRMAMQQVGTIALLLFMFYITFNDIMRFDSIARIFGRN